ncbi:hypothetical protein MG293_004165 [Ovis ammon polii]|uniref:Uncharacterized protein n=1 Tax=Ovis ammon polii TaxID=230172 RepID=A0AAD4UPS3_OVIAM|nr:hypothetical protein MG293_004165 [Ovis ammon polii]
MESPDCQPPALGERAPLLFKPPGCGPSSSGTWDIVTCILGSVCWALAEAGYQSQRSSASQTRRGRLQDSTVLRAPGDETLCSRRGLGPKHDIAKEQLSKTLALWSSVFSSAEDSLSSRRRWSLTHSPHDESENSATK